MSHTMRSDCDTPRWWMVINGSLRFRWEGVTRCEHTVATDDETCSPTFILVRGRAAGSNDTTARRAAGNPFDRVLLGPARRFTCEGSAFLARPAAGGRGPGERRPAGRRALWVGPGRRG